MFKDLLPSFSIELLKLSAAKPPEVGEKAPKDWRQFDKKLKNKGFQSTVTKEVDDPKLKKYVKNYGGMLTSKQVAGTSPSRTSNKTYKIKVLPSGRLACECKDWQYRKSVDGGDCDHIKALKKSGLTKVSNAFLKGVGKGVNGMIAVEKAKLQSESGKAYKENARRIGMGANNNQLIQPPHPGYVSAAKRIAGMAGHNG
jgi:hypothetical protein